MRVARAALVVVVACSGNHPGDDPSPDASGTDSPPDGAAFVDRDQDGLDDLVEQQLAEAYLPFVSLDPGDGCTLDGYVVRVRKHPMDPTKIHIVYDHLFQRDCGLGGHVGDDEVFGVTIDPEVAAPAGILAMKTASHQNTACERNTSCTTCPGDGRPKCDMAPDGGAMWPVLYASKDKHGQYATKAQCPLFGTCFDQCTLNATRKRAPIVNAGEPGHPLVNDLTDQGFINATNGWTEAALMHVDPWAPGDFGGAGGIASDLVDTTFDVAPCM